MNAAARLGAYAVVLAGSLGAGAAIGSCAGPLDVDGTERHEAPEVGDPADEGHTGEPDH